MMKINWEATLSLLLTLFVVVTMWADINNLFCVIEYHSCTLSIINILFIASFVIRVMWWGYDLVLMCFDEVPEKEVKQ